MSIERIDSNNGLKVNFLFEDKINQLFAKKIQDYLHRISSDFLWLLNSELNIKSSNTFPHSSGIASSASSMSALALCILSLDEQINDKKYPAEIFYTKASYYARLASGSACRSLFPLMSIWNKEEESATVFHDIDPLFQTLNDSIIIVDEKEKSVSSRNGHALMENHSYAPARYQDAESNLSKLKIAMKTGNFLDFTAIVEHEALSLHALMMTSTPNVLLLKPESLEIILKVKKWRDENHVPIAFTIDAGPNIHLIYPDHAKTIIQDFIKNNFSDRFRNIHDQMGQGPINN